MTEEWLKDVLGHVCRDRYAVVVLPSLAALTGFSGVCGFIWQPNLRQSVFHSTFFWNLSRLQWISPGVVDAAVVTDHAVCLQVGLS